MLAVAAGLMAPLGYWVSQKASRATEVALNQIDGIRCPAELAAVTPDSKGTANGDNLAEEDLLDEGAVLPQDEVEEAPEAGGEVLPGGESRAADGTKERADDAGEMPTGESEGGADEERVRPTIKVNIDDSEMPEEPVVVVGSFESPPPTATEIEKRSKARSQCLQHIENEKESVLARKLLIRNVMLFSGLVLLIGLGFYGIKTTHRVAGPLFKVGLYLAKLERNVYDTVYNLRKGDQLVEFYDHFKGAHAGVTKMQEQDRDRLRDAIALSKDAGLAAKDPKLATLVAELEALLDETEKSLGTE